jgi:FMN phosphatase YigB (HAD superfamily)
MDAVVFDLFGTLVAAPTPHERSQAASRLAALVGCEAGAVESYLLSSWLVRVLYVGDGGGDELHGALAAGMAATRVHRRGTADGLAFGATSWAGSTLDSVERVPAYLAELK